MTTLTLSTGSADQTNTFRIRLNSGRTITAALCKDYERQGDGILWAMQVGGAIKDRYTDADRAEQTRLAGEQPVRDAEHVTIGGDLYRMRLLGDYSDCAIFDRI